MYEARSRFKGELPDGMGVKCAPAGGQYSREGRRERTSHEQFVVVFQEQRPVGGVELGRHGLRLDGKVGLLLERGHVDAHRMWLEKKLTTQLDLCAPELEIRLSTQVHWCDPIPPSLQRNVWETPCSPS